MKLYRGSRQALQIPTADQHAEWEKLGMLKNRLVDEAGNILKGYELFGKENQQRYAQLVELIRAKEFSDAEELARSYAGTKGYLTTITIDDKELQQRGRPN